MMVKDSTLYLQDIHMLYQSIFVMYFYLVLNFFEYTQIDTLILVFRETNVALCFGVYTMIHK
jgi:hypothetical protein